MRCQINLYDRKGDLVRTSLAKTTLGARESLGWNIGDEAFVAIITCVKTGKIADIAFNANIGVVKFWRFASSLRKRKGGNLLHIGARSASVTAERPRRAMTLAYEAAPGPKEAVAYIHYTGDGRPWAAVIKTEYGLLATACPSKDGLSILTDDDNIDQEQSDSW